jgi:hypothetical protein
VDSYHFGLSIVVDEVNLLPWLFWDEFLANFQWLKRVVIFLMEFVRKSSKRGGKSVEKWLQMLQERGFF